MNVTRNRMMLDAKLLGATMRNLAAIEHFDNETMRHVWVIRDRILRRYGANDVMGCLLMIAMRVKASDGK
jgi:hypothetical protein